MSNHRINLLNHGIDIYENKHSDGNLVKEHHHEFHQLLYALDGEGKIMLSGKTFVFKQDCCVIITPFTEHSVFSESKMTVLVLAFGKDALDSMIQREFLERFFSKPQMIVPHPFGRIELRQLLRKMIFEQTNGGFLNFLAMKIYLYEILLVCTRLGHAAQVTDANDLRAERLRSYIDTHYYEISDSQALASKLGLSTRHMNSIFKDRYHVTPVQYLAEVRVELSKKLLTETDKDISAICFEVGFENLSSFYRTFKNFTQVSPNTFRKTYSNRTEK